MSAKWTTHKHSDGTVASYENEGEPGIPGNHDHRFRNAGRQRSIRLHSQGQRSNDLGRQELSQRGSGEGMGKKGDGAVMATKKNHLKSYSWDTDADSYDVDIYSSGGVTHSAHVVITHDNGSAEAATVTFHSRHACIEYVENLRERTKGAAKAWAKKEIGL